jgi:hypothetical protein
LSTTTGVWNIDANNDGFDDYIAVWHFPHDINASTSDSTVNSNDVAEVENNASTTISGRIDGAFQFDGANTRLVTTKSNSIKGRIQVTVSLWLYPTRLDNTVQYIYQESKDISGSNRLELRLRDTNNGLNFAGRAPDSDPATYWTSTGALTQDTWQHVVAVFDSVTDLHHIYVDGDDNSNSVPEPGFDNTDPNHPPYIGNDPGSVYPFAGLIDEVRVASGTRSRGWITTEYNNQKANSSFLNIGGETMSGGSFWGEVSLSGTTGTLTFATSTTYNLTEATDFVIDMTVVELESGGATTPPFMFDGAFKLKGKFQIKTGGGLVSDQMTMDFDSLESSSCTLDVTENVTEVEHIVEE